MELIEELNQSQKFHGKDVLPNDSIFYRLFSVNYYLIFKDDEYSQKLFEEMNLNFQRSLNNFAFFCFEQVIQRKSKRSFNYYSVSNNSSDLPHEEYLILSFEDNCYIINTKINNFKKNFIYLFNLFKEFLLIAAGNKDLNRFIELFDLSKSIKADKESENMKNKIILIQEKKIIDEIDTEISSCMSNSFIIGIKSQLQQKNQSFYDVIKLISFRSIMTYSIRRFYFPTNLFQNPNFFGKEKEFYENTKANFNNCSDLATKYKPKKNIQMIEMDRNDFIVLRMIGKGSNSTIFLIFHIHLEKIFALKEFFDESHYQKEKGHFSRLKFYHPNVVKCYGYTNNCLIIEFMSNGTLQSLINSNGNESYSINSIYSIELYSSYHYFRKFQYNIINNQVNKMKMIIEIIFGLQYLHLNDMIYRDIKPDNIFIDHDFLIHLGDFDLSCSDDFFSSNLDKTTNIGTLKYFSPDISFNNGVYSYKSDNFTLGLIIYLICTGKNLLDDHASILQADDLQKVIKNKFINFSFGPICSFLNGCLQLDFINRVSLCELNNDLYKNQVFFRNLGNKACFNFVYSDIFQEIQFLFQNFYELVIEFIHIFSHEISQESANDENTSKINLSHVILILSYIFQVQNLKKLATSLTNELQTIIKYIENQIQMIHNYKKTKDCNYDQLKNTKKTIFSLLQLIYSQETMPFYDIEKSKSFLLKSVKNNDAISQCILGIKYYDGDSAFHKDLNLSILYFTLSSEGGFAQSQYNLGEIYSNLHEYPVRITIPQLGIDTDKPEFFGKQAIKYYTQAKRMNYLSAIYGLSILYFNGECGISINKKKAIHYLTRSKNQFHRLSISYYFKCFMSNLIDVSEYDINKFEQEAAFMAENFNDEIAQIELGNFYWKRLNNLKKAEYYFNMAARQNVALAYTSIANIYLYNSKRLNSIEIEKKSFDYFLSAAKLNDPTALFYVGLRYYLGDRPYLKQDTKKALEFIQKSSNLNFPKSQALLGYFYFKGVTNYIEKNYQKSIYYLKLAAENKKEKNKYAIDLLGLIYLEGKIVERNINSALYYFKSAANLKSFVSKHQLGFLFEVGEKNLNETLLIHTETNFDVFPCYNACFCFIKSFVKEDKNDGQDRNFLLSCPLLSIQYYRESIYAYSCYNLAAIYFAGKHVKRDVKLAVDLLKKSAQNSIFAAFFLYLIFVDGVDNIIKKDLGVANYYLKMSNLSYSGFKMTINDLVNCRYLYKVMYGNFNEIEIKNDLSREIDLYFYDGFLSPHFDDQLGFKNQLIDKLSSKKLK